MIEIDFEDEPEDSDEPEPQRDDDERGVEAHGSWAGAPSAQPPSS